MPSEASREKRSKKLLIAVGLAAFVIRLVYLAQLVSAPFFHLRLGDAEAYHQWALQIAGGDWMGQQVFYQAPLYPYFLSAIYSVLGEGVAFVRLVQAALGAGSCVLLAAAGIALFGRRGAIAGVLLAVYPSAIFFDGLLEKTALTTFLTCSLLYVLSERRLKFREFLAGSILGLLALTRENAILLAIPVSLWFVIGERRQARVAVAAFVGGCALVLMPVAVRNFMVGGELHLTTSQFGPNFYIGNHAGARGLYEPLVPGRGNAEAEREDATRLAEEASGHPLSPEQVSEYWSSRAFEFIGAQPVAWGAQLARKLALTYNAVEIADTESQEVYAEQSPLLRALSPFTFGVLFCGAAFGAVMTIGEFRRLWFVYAIVLTYTVSVVVFYVFARYRIPLVPMLMLLAAGATATLREPCARPLRTRALAAAVLAAVLAHLPLETTRMDRISHYVSVGNLLLPYSQHWDQADAFYARALEESPNDPAAHYGMGMLLALRQQPRKALEHYRIAVAGWDGNADVHVNYALALADVGDATRAFAELEAGEQRRPIGQAPYVLLGNLMLKQYRPSEAAKAFTRALEIEPGDPHARSGMKETEILLMHSRQQ